MGDDSDDMIISIHAAREGGDAKLKNITDTDGRISIHAAREGGDPYIKCGNFNSTDFNPRRP